MELCPHWFNTLYLPDTVISVKSGRYGMDGTIFQRCHKKIPISLAKCCNTFPKAFMAKFLLSFLFIMECFILHVILIHSESVILFQKLYNIQTLILLSKVGVGILDDTHLFRTAVGVISASSHFHIFVIQGKDLVYVVHSRIVRTARSRSHYLHIWIINLKSDEKVDVTKSGIIGDIWK